MEGWEGVRLLSIENNLIPTPNNNIFSTERRALNAHTDPQTPQEIDTTVNHLADGQRLRSL